MPGRPRDPGDAWVIAEDGTRYWGAFGAAGLLALDPARGILLQHRAEYSHFGGTWGLPGGARRQSESAIDAALREAGEEAGVPTSALRVRATSVADLRVWSYTTVLAEVVTEFDAVISDPESLALDWIRPDDVDALDLHPGFAAAWPGLRDTLPLRPALVIDIANVMGTVPDGWWRDRAGAAQRLVNDLGGLDATGIAAAELDLPGDRWFPRWRAVLEGDARSADEAAGPIEIVRASGSGDDSIVAEAAALAAEGWAVTVVTSDRELRARVQELGAGTRPAGWLRRHLGMDT